MREARLATKRDGLSDIRVWALNEGLAVQFVNPSVL